MLETWKSAGKKFQDEHRWLIISVIILIGLLYGKHALSAGYFYDSEDCIYFNDAALNWLDIGRWGSVLTLKLFGLEWFNPYQGVIGMVGFALTVLLMLFVFYMAGMRRKSLCVFAFLFISSPIWAFQFYFTMQWIQTTWALALLVMVCGMNFSILRKENWNKTNKYKKVFIFALETIALLWAISIYQSFIFMAIGMYAALFLTVLCEDGDKTRGVNIKRLFCWGIWMAGNVIAAYLLYTVITKVYFETNSYLDSQILWGKLPKEEIMSKMKGYLFACHFGKGNIYTFAAGIGVLGLVIHNFRVWLNRKFNIQYKLLSLLTSLAVWLSMTLLSFYMGQAPAARGQMQYPLVVAFLAAFALENVDRLSGRISRNILDTVLIVCFAASVWGQTANTLRYWYTDDIRYEMDLGIAQVVADDIGELGLGAVPTCPVTFVGNYTPAANNACFDVYTCPDYMVSDWSIGVSCWRRIGEGDYRVHELFADHLGLRYIRSAESAALARQLAADMPSYPTPGYVQLKEGIIVVKMSN